MRIILGMCGGFLLAIIWMDMMFDIQAYRAKSKTLPENILSTTTLYYRQITKGADPMRQLITFVMAVLGLALVYDLALGTTPFWYRGVSFILAVPGPVLALARTLKNAMRLSERRDSIEVQSAMAHSLFFDHVVSFVLMSAFLLWQVFGAFLAG
jgi:hypothetical protein